MEERKLMYATVADIMRLLNVARSPATRLYKIADKIDSDELGDWRIEPRKVRVKTVLKVAGLNRKDLEK